MLDPAEVAERDRRMKAAMKDPALGLKPPPEPRLGYACAYRAADTEAGYLSVQGPVRHAGREGLFDDVIGKGWQLLLRSTNGPAVIEPSTASIIQQMGIVVADFGPQGDTQDPEEIYSAWFDRIGAEAVLVRPDFYIFGTSSLANIGALTGSAWAMMNKADVTSSSAKS